MILYIHLPRLRCHLTIAALYHNHQPQHWLTQSLL